MVDLGVLFLMGTDYFREHAKSLDESYWELVLEALKFFGKFILLAFGFLVYIVYPKAKWLHKLRHKSGFLTNELESRADRIDFDDGPPVGV